MRLLGVTYVSLLTLMKTDSPRLHIGLSLTHLPHP